MTIISVQDIVVDVYKNLVGLATTGIEFNPQPGG